MAYKINITNHANDLIDSSVYYIVDKLKNRQAAKHLLKSIHKVYERLEENPFQFSACRNSLLADRGYREARLSDMSYKLIFRIDKKLFTLLGFFTIWKITLLKFLNRPN